MKRLLRWLIRRQEGQSLVIIGLGMIGLLGIVALVVDAGNAYALQRKVRNAVDAAAMAGARELARQGATTNASVLSQARRYASANHVHPEDLEVYYCDLDGNPLQPVNNDSFAPPTEVDGKGVAGVLVRGRGRVPAYLAHLVGVRSFSASETSMGWVSCGVCSAGDLFPAAISLDTFASHGGEPLIGPPYTFWGDKTAPGNFGWVSWNANPGHTSNPTLVDNIRNPSNSGEWHVGDWIFAGPGVQNSSQVAAAIQELIDTGKNEVTLPVYSAIQGQGSNVQYQIAGFVRLELVGFDFQGQDKRLIGYFKQWVEPGGEGGCADLGVCSVKLRRPMTERRAITGVVSAWEPRLTAGATAGGFHMPVDVVTVIDVSRSMGDRWRPGQETKLATAKRALIAFNNQLLPEEGDRVGLVTFPKGRYGEWYSPLCSSAWTNVYYDPEVRSSLTSNVASVNAIIDSLGVEGGTPLAAAMQLARNTVLPNGVADPGRVPVIILATDGAANCTVDGRWTGFSGEGEDSPACNDMAVQHAIEQANIAKQAGVIIFTIAVGDDFDPAFLPAMATEDTHPDKPHFFQVNGPDELVDIYSVIADRVNNIGSECQVKEYETTGDNAVVSIYRNGNLYAQTTASETGSYVFPDVEPGEYTFSVTMYKNGLLYDVLTNVIGGPPAEGPITLTVGAPAGTYVRDLYLRTTTPLNCH
jgi:hypothetical protein